MIKSTINLWDYIEKEIKEFYSDKVCLLYSEEGSAFDGWDEFSPTFLDRYVFDNVEQLREHLESEEKDLPNILYGFTDLWINGKRDKSIIWELRG